jgi:hypothetical protein
LNHIGFHSTELKPPLVTSIVIPSVLYGCEVWNDLKNKDLLLLNKLQHFVAKHAHKFSTLTRSDICESMVGLYSQNPV